MRGQAGPAGQTRRAALGALTALTALAASAGGLRHRRGTGPGGRGAGRAQAPAARRVPRLVAPVPAPAPGAGRPLPRRRARLPGLREHRPARPGRSPTRSTTWRRSWRGCSSTIGFTGPMGLYMQDYGGPVGNRILGRHPDWLEWQVIQNANAYEEGFTGAWDAIRHALWVERPRDGGAA